MLKSSNGDRLFRKVIITVYFPDKIFPPKKFSQHAGPKSGYNQDSIDQMIEGIVDQLDTLYPYWEFKLTPLAPEGRTAKFAVTFAGYRKDVIERMQKDQAAAALAEQNKPKESSAPPTEAAVESISADAEALAESAASGVGE